MTTSNDSAFSVIQYFIVSSFFFLLQRRPCLEKKDMVLYGTEKLKKPWDSLPRVRSELEGNHIWYFSPFELQIFLELNEIIFLDIVLSEVGKKAIIHTKIKKMMVNSVSNASPVKQESPLYWITIGRTQDNRHKTYFWKH